MRTFKLNIIYFGVISVGILIATALAFEILFKILDRGVYYPPLSLNVKLHNPNSEFKFNVKDSVREKSNDSLVGDEFLIRTGSHREILGKKECNDNLPVIYAIGSSTTEQKLVLEGYRWTDILNKYEGENGQYCVRNYGYGGVNLSHISDTLHYLFSEKLPEAVIIMSNATDVGQLMRYESYSAGTNHYSKERIIQNGRIDLVEEGWFPGIRFLYSKFVGNEIKSSVSENKIEINEQLKRKYTQIYLEKFLKIKKVVLANNIPLIYISEPRILDLKKLNPDRAKKIYSHYRNYGIDYDQMSEIHISFARAIKDNFSSGGRGCYIDTSELNDPSYLYDEGHLNSKGNEILATQIYAVLNNLSLCL